MKPLVMACVLAAVLASAVAGAGQLAGRTDAPVATAMPLAEGIVGDWRGTLYVADQTRNFARVDVSFRFTGYGLARYTRGPLTGRPVEDVGFADYMVVGDSVLLSLHGSGFPITLVGVHASGSTLEFVVPTAVALGGTLVEGGYVLTRQ